MNKTKKNLEEEKKKNTFFIIVLILTFKDFIRSYIKNV